MDKLNKLKKTDEAAWRPTIERDPEVNAFVSVQDPKGEMENPPPLEDPEAEEGESVEDDRVAREATRTGAPIAPSKSSTR